MKKEIYVASYKATAPNGFEKMGSRSNYASKPEQFIQWVKQDVIAYYQKQNGIAVKVKVNIVHPPQISNS